MTLEDAQHRRQRTKVELFEGYAFVVLRPVTMARDTVTATEHEIHAIAGDDFLVTVRWTPLYALDAVETRWSAADLHGAGFALYVLLDEVVDGYLSVVEGLEDEADELEDVVFERDDSERGSQVQERLFRLKHRPSFFDARPPHSATASTSCRKSLRSRPRRCLPTTAT